MFEHPNRRFRLMPGGIFKARYERWEAIRINNTTITARNLKDANWTERIPYTAITEVIRHCRPEDEE